MQLAKLKSALYLNNTLGFFFSPQNRSLMSIFI